MWCECGVVWCGANVSVVWCECECGVSVSVSVSVSVV